VPWSARCDGSVVVHVFFGFGESVVYDAAYAGREPEEGRWRHLSKVGKGCSDRGRSKGSKALPFQEAQVLQMGASKPVQGISPGGQLRRW